MTQGKPLITYCTGGDMVHKAMGKYCFCLFVGSDGLEWSLGGEQFCCHQIFWTKLGFKHNNVLGLH